MKHFYRYSAILILLLNPYLSPAIDNFDDLYFAEDQQTLTPQEKAALALVKRWQAGPAQQIKPLTSPEGAVRFVFGTSYPQLVCAVLQICDVELQAGEQVNSINLGDTTRWTIEPAITGSGLEEIQHLMIKPLDVGLTTSLVVTTNRRTYHLRLRSHRTDFMPHVAFIYPNEILKKWQKLKTRDQEHQQQQTLPDTGEYLNQLDFNYVIKGEADWKPIRVYNDGHKTIIQMPTTIQQTEAPTLLIVRGQRGLFEEAEEVMVNYRFQGDRYIVDTLFQEAILIAGVGSNQQRITLTREAI